MMTRLAALERMSNDFLMVRLKEGVTIDRPGIREIVDAGRAMPLRQPLPVVVTIPEDTDLDLAVMRMDHAVQECPCDHLGMLAIASESTLMHSLAKLYFAYFPQDFPVGVFSTVQEAMTWVEEQRTTPSTETTPLP